MTTPRLAILTVVFTGGIVAIADLLVDVLVVLPFSTAGFLAAFAVTRSCRSQIDAATVGPVLVRLLQAWVLAGLVGLWLGVLVGLDRMGPVVATVLAAGFGAWLGVVWAVRPAIVLEEKR